MATASETSVRSRGARIARGPVAWAGRLVVGFGATRALAGLFLLGLIAVRVWDPGPIELVRLKAFDFYQQLKPREAVERPVVIVDINEESLSKFGQWPWPRTLVARLLKAISDAGSVSTALDIVFPEPDRTSPARVASLIDGLSDGVRAELAKAPDHDRVLADVVSGSRVVLGESVVVDIGAVHDLTAVPKTGYAALGADPLPYLFEFPHLLPNIPELEAAAAGRGMLAIKPDIDGIVRRVPLVMRASGRVMPALSLELVRVATGQKGFLIKADGAGVSSIVIAGLEVPTDRNARLWVHFGPHDESRFVSAIDVLDGRIGADVLGGKLVLVGTSASGLYDNRSTPLEAAMPGVEAHAQTIENILTGTFLHQPNYMLGAEVVATLAVGTAIIILTPVLGPIMVLVMGALVTGSALAASWYMFDQQRVLVDITFPSLATFSVFALLAFTNYYREAKQKLQVRSAFGQYLSPTLVNELAEDPGRLVLGGETREVTILFSDVRGFTAISESFRDDPQGLTRLMNRFLTPFSNAIIERRGTIDKYMGDAIMAFWNAPLDDPDHAVNACRSGLEIQTRNRALNEALKQEAARGGQVYRPLQVGVGINTGTCVVGNMGSELRFDYTVMGDAVNLASRIEGQTKDYGVRAIVGEETAARVADRFALIELDLIRVLGKDEPVRIYALLGDQEMAGSEPFGVLKAAQQAFLGHYRGRGFNAALQQIDASRAVDGNGALAAYHEVMALRCRAYIDAPPPPDWDGVHVAETK